MSPPSGRWDGLKYRHKKGNRPRRCFWEIPQKPIIAAALKPIPCDVKDGEMDVIDAMAYIKMTHGRIARTMPDSNRATIPSAV